MKSHNTIELITDTDSYALNLSPYVWVRFWQDSGALWNQEHDWPWLSLIAKASATIILTV